jgi:hypothetical protein
MVFQNKSVTYYLTLKAKSITSLRISMGYIDSHNEVYEVTFDI